MRVIPKEMPYVPLSANRDAFYVGMCFKRKHELLQTPLVFKLEQTKTTGIGASETNRVHYHQSILLKIFKFYASSISFQVVNQCSI